MMTKNPSNEREQLEMLTIDQLVPNNHLVRKLEAAIDFSFIYPLVEQLYLPNGRPSIDPVVLFKMTFIQYVFGIRSMCQTIKEIETNMAYRWFLFEQIFYRILKEIMHQGLLHADHLFIDSTHVKTSYLDMADSLREHLCSKRMLDTAMIYQIMNMKEKEK